MRYEISHFAKGGGDQPPRLAWLQFLTAYNYSLEHRKRSVNVTVGFLSRLPIDAAGCDRSGRSHLTPAKDEDTVFFIRFCGLTRSGHRDWVLAWVS